MTKSQLAAGHTHTLLCVMMEHHEAVSETTKAVCFHQTESDRVEKKGGNRQNPFEVGIHLDFSEARFHFVDAEKLQSYSLTIMGT